MAETKKDSGVGDRKEAFGAYYFAVHIEGENIEDNYFRSCSGLKSESEVQEIAEGGLNTTTHKLIGRTKFPNIVLKKGFSGAPFTLWKLRQRVLNDIPGREARIKRFNGVIIQKGPGGTEAKWTFVGGWIAKWEGPEFDASKNEVSIETVEIAHEGLTKLTK
jgi:phage tail-like protein